MSSFLVYLITDPAYDVVEITRAALSVATPGDVAVMARNKRGSATDLAALGSALLPICRARGARLLVNDRCDVAIAIGADGAHLPEAGLSVRAARRVLGPEALIGQSRHGPASDDESASDFVVLGPVGDVPKKGPPMGEHAFAEACASYAQPVYALGGVDAETAPRLVARGARGVAVIRAIYASSDPAASMARLLSSIRAREDGRPRTH